MKTNADALTKILQHLIANVGPFGLKKILESEETAYYAAMNLGLSAQLEAQARVEAACRACIEKMGGTTQMMIAGYIREQLDPSFEEEAA